MRYYNITGHRYGRLTVLAIAGKALANREAIWHARCDCGACVDVPRSRLVNCVTKSCGCYRAERAGMLSRREHA